MPWFKVDDGFWGHPKRLACPLSAIGLWVAAGSWSAQQMTDGHVPRHVLAVLGGKPKDAAALVHAGLWRTTATGWLFHGWDDMQPTRAQTEAKRADDAERKRQAREEKAARLAAEKAKRGDPSGKRPDGHAAESERSPEGIRSASALPDPTRPDPTRSSVLTSQKEVEVKLPASPANFATSPPDPDEPDPAEQATAGRTLRAALAGWPEADPDEIRQLA